MNLKNVVPVKKPLTYELLKASLVRVLHFDMMKDAKHRYKLAVRDAMKI
jgi:hypothetical protein